MRGHQPVRETCLLVFLNFLELTCYNTLISLLTYVNQIGTMSSARLYFQRKSCVCFLFQNQYWLFHPKRFGWSAVLLVITRAQRRTARQTRSLPACRSCRCDFLCSPPALPPAARTHAASHTAPILTSPQRSPGSRRVLRSVIYNILKNENAILRGGHKVGPRGKIHSPAGDFLNIYS